MMTTFVMMLVVWLRPWLDLCEKREKPMRESLIGGLAVVYMVEQWRFSIDRWRAMETTMEF